LANNRIGLFSALFFLTAGVIMAAPSVELTPEEELFLGGRENTIVVYPEANNPPFSYQSPSGHLQGLSIDYLELVAEKVGIKIEYLTPRSRSQVLTDMRAGKGDVAYLTPDREREGYLLFTESYVTVPVVIVVRKDAPRKSGLTLGDFNGKKVAMVADSAIENYTEENYPRVVRESTTDDEVSLQQVVLGEVDAAVMDVASLTFFLSKQVLSSVQIAGSTGLDYKPAFAIPKDRALLQSILELGLFQVSAADRELLNEKWIRFPGEVEPEEGLFSTLKNNIGELAVYLLIAVALLGTIVFLGRRERRVAHYFSRMHGIGEIKTEIGELESASRTLEEELKFVKAEEEKLKGKLDKLEP